MAAELAVVLRRASRRLSVWLLKGLSAPSFRASLFKRLEKGGRGASAAIEVFLALGPEIDPESRWTDPHRCVGLFKVVIPLLDSKEHTVVVSAVRLLSACSVKASMLTPIHLAVLQSDHKALQSAVDAITDRAELETTTGPAGYTALWWACALGSRPCAARLLASSASATVRAGPRGLTAMMAAARVGSARVLEVLLAARGMSSQLLNARADGGSGPTAIYMAAELGHAAVVLALLGAGAMAEAKVTPSHTLLGVAAAKGHEHALSALLDDPDAASGVDARNDQGRTALFEAALFGRAACAKLLVAAGAHAGIASKDGSVALLAALSNLDDAYDAGVVSGLVAHLDQVPTAALAASRGSLTMLHLAALHGHRAAAEALLARGASPTVPSADGLNALSHACAAGKLSTAQAIAATGKVSLAEPSRAQVDPPIVLAAAGAHEGVVRWLLSQGVSPVTSVGGRRRSALMAAAGADHLGLVQALLAATPGEGARAADAHGHTALHYAARAFGSSPAVVAALLRAGLDPSEASASGQTAFWLACSAGRAKAAKAMLQAAGRRISLDATFRGETALMAAVAADSPKTVRLLLAVGARAAGVPGCASALTVALLGGKAKAATELLQRPLALGDLNAPDAGYWGGGADGATPAASGAEPRAPAPSGAPRLRSATAAGDGAGPAGTSRRKTVGAGQAGRGKRAGGGGGCRGQSRLAYRRPLPPLLLACVRGSPPPLVAALLDAGCDGAMVVKEAAPAVRGVLPPRAGTRVVSALTLAAEARAWDTVRLLIERGCVAPGCLASRDPETGDTVLHRAAEDGEVAAIAPLLEAGAAALAPAGYGWTALQYAAALGHAATVRAFLGNERGSAEACLEHEDESGLTAVELAAARGRAGCVAALLAAGAEPRSSLRLAAAQGEAETVRAVLAGRAVGTMVPQELSGALLEAVRARSAACVRLLVGGGAAKPGGEDEAEAAETAVPGRFVASALQSAASKGHHDIVSALLDACGNVVRAVAVAGAGGRAAVELCRAAQSAKGVAALLAAGAAGVPYDPAMSGNPVADVCLDAEASGGDCDDDAGADGDDHDSGSAGSGEADALADALAAATASL